jgi:hypothetical protein
MWPGGHQTPHAHGSTFPLYFNGVFEISLSHMVTIQSLLETIMDSLHDLVYSINPKKWLLIVHGHVTMN